MGSVSAEGKKVKLFSLCVTGQTELQENSQVTEPSLERNSLG